jgi:hypothetical protein
VSASRLPGDIWPGDIWDVKDIVDQLGHIRRGWRAQHSGHSEYGVDGFPRAIAWPSWRRNCAACFFRCALARSCAAAQ